ncbi:MAG TPA: anti-sigma factor [Gemmatimonadaceae bacterium]|nr:anti-sigma factor [Gemmatimonadaceae bacterium]
MQCTECTELLSAYMDDELMREEQQAVREHLATCADCAREEQALALTSRRIKESFMRHSTPDVLKARIRNALAQDDAFTPPPAQASPRVWPRWPTLAAAGLIVAIASSTLTATLMRQSAARNTLAGAIADSHIRSLMPGHLTDVVSTNQHQVKPWFNGRVDLSPAVPNLDSAGFPLAGGRVDYVDGHAVAVVTYTRRQHVINVYARPTDERSSSANESRNGFHMIEWQSGGLDYWAVSDLNSAELAQFIALFKRG